MASIEPLLKAGQIAARAGERARARRKFRAALIFDPANVTALLWLAWLSDDPRASLAYIARALARDPQNPRAHAALRWARRRAALPTSPPPPPSPPTAPPVLDAQESTNRVFWKKPGLLAILSLLAVLIGGALICSLQDSLPASAALAPAATPFPTTTVAASPTHPPSPLQTATGVPTLTPTATHTPTPRPTETGTPTHLPTATPSSAIPTAPPLPPTATLAPSSIQSNVRWIDVDLTHQRLTAYEGQKVVRTTLVSTGLPRTPTPTGRYHIQIKLRYDDMSGPTYYLRNVPYTMYFHGGYGLHGTYWHNNFGHPMSHGCVNLPTPEAEWLFNWAAVGTMVNIHD